MASHLVRFVPLVVAVLPPLAGCAQQREGFPSLLPRAIEQRSDAVAVSEPVAAVPDPALDRRIAELTGSLAEADAAFGAAADRADRLSRASGPVGGERWIEAQVALAELDTLRAPVVGIVADLEALVIDRGTSGAPPYPALDAAITDARARNAAQIARVAAIEERLAPA